MTDSSPDLLTGGSPWLPGGNGATFRHGSRPARDETGTRDRRIETIRRRRPSMLESGDQERLEEGSRRDSGGRTGKGPQGKDQEAANGDLGRDRGDGRGRNPAPVIRNQIRPFGGPKALTPRSPDAATPRSPVSASPVHPEPLPAPSPPCVSLSRRCRDFARRDHLPDRASIEAPIGGPY